MGLGFVVDGKGWSMRKLQSKIGSTQNRRAPTPDREDGDERKKVAE